MRVAINGFGRIGKLVFRAFLEQNLKNIEIVAINELGSLDSSCHLIKFDTTHRRLPIDIKKTKTGLKYNWMKKNANNNINFLNILNKPLRWLNIKIKGFGLKRV